MYLPYLPLGMALMGVNVDAKGTRLNAVDDDVD